LVKPFLPNTCFGPLEEFVLTFDNRPANSSLPRLIALDAFLERDIEKQNQARHLVFPRQVQ
jgi:hypothetical protein